MSAWLIEKNQNAEFVTWEVNQAYTREKKRVDATDGEIQPGAVIEYAPGKFGISLNRIPKGFVGKATLIVRGAAIVILRLLFFPVVTAPDGPDAGVDNVAESASATAAKRVEALAALSALGIIARD